jgi:hypothetical protein
MSLILTFYVTLFHTSARVLQYVMVIFLTKRLHRLPIPQWADMLVKSRFLDYRNSGLQYNAYLHKLLMHQYCCTAIIVLIPVLPMLL